MLLILVDHRPGIHLDDICLFLLSSKVGLLTEGDPGGLGVWRKELNTRGKGKRGWRDVVGFKDGTISSKCCSDTAGLFVPYVTYVSLRLKALTAFSSSRKTSSKNHHNSSHQKGHHSSILFGLHNESPITDDKQINVRRAANVVVGHDRYFPHVNIPN